MQPWEQVARRIIIGLFAYAAVTLGIARHLARVGDEQLWTEI